MFWICKWTVSVRSPFSICSPSDDLQKRWCVTSFLKSFVDCVITLNFPCINWLLSFIVASHLSGVEIRQIVSSSLDHHPPLRKHFKIAAPLLPLSLALRQRPVFSVWVSSELFGSTAWTWGLLLILMMYFKTSSTDILTVSSCLGSFPQLPQWKIP